MSKKEIYKTVARETETLLTEKKSKFISHVKPVDTEEAALEFLNKIRSEHPSATHNVYAYVIDEIIFHVIPMTESLAVRRECLCLTPLKTADL